MLHNRLVLQSLAGLLALVLVLPAATASNEEWTKIVRRFSTIALASVVVLALSRLGRAVMELGAVSQIWSTSYGRVLIVKSALFVPLLALGWLNRTLLLGQFPRLRRSAILELFVLLGIVVAVAVLTELGPGTTQSHAARASTPLQAAEPPTRPTRDSSAPTEPEREPAGRADRRDTACHLWEIVQQAEDILSDVWSCDLETVERNRQAVRHARQVQARRRLSRVIGRTADKSGRARPAPMRAEKGAQKLDLPEAAPGSHADAKPDKARVSPIARGILGRE